MSDENRTKALKRAAWNAAWMEVRIRHCLREAATVAHLSKRSALRDEFIIVAGRTFDEVADELEELSRLRPEWPHEDEFAVAAPGDPTPSGGNDETGGETP